MELRATHGAFRQRDTGPGACRTRGRRRRPRPGRPEASPRPGRTAPAPAARGPRITRFRGSPRSCPQSSRYERRRPAPARPADRVSFSVARAQAIIAGRRPLHRADPVDHHVSRRDTRLELPQSRSSYDLIPCVATRTGPTRRCHLSSPGRPRYPPAEPRFRPPGAAPSATRFSRCRAASNPPLGRPLPAAIAPAAAPPHSRRVRGA